jgi:hypothetical protein
MVSYQLSSFSYCDRNFWKSRSSMTSDFMLPWLWADRCEAAEASLPSFFSLSC